MQDCSTDFEFLPIDVSLARCQRYFQSIGGVSDASISSGMSNTTTASVFTIHYKSTMRVAPTHAVNDLKATDNTTYDKTITGISSTQSSINTSRLYVDHASGATQFRPASLLPQSTSSTSRLTLDAEL